jgi:hypothetical protein
LHEEPSKELDLRGRPSLPYDLVHVGGNGAKELNLIRGLGGVNAIRREVPSYVILHFLPKLKVVKKDPKLHELLELLHVVDFLQVDLLNPIVVTQGKMDFPILPFRDIVD